MLTVIYFLLHFILFQEIIVPDGAEECVMADFDPSAHARGHGRQEAYDSDDEGGPQGQRVQCASH